MGLCIHGRQECYCGIDRSTKSLFNPCKGCGFETTYPEYCDPCWEKFQDLTCRHPHVSRSWIGYSGYFHCYRCDQIIEGDL